MIMIIKHRIAKITSLACKFLNWKLCPLKKLAIIMVLYSAWALSTSLGI